MPRVVQVWQHHTRTQRCVCVSGSTQQQATHISVSVRFSSVATSPEVSQDVSDVSDTAPEVSQDVSDDSDTQALCWPSFCMCLHMMVYIRMYICTYIRMYIRTLRSYQCKRTHLRYITSYPVFAGLVAKYKACYV